MIISPGRRYILVHIPKTGGTALSLALEARARADDILIGDTPKARARRRRLAALTPRGRLWKHSTLADIEGVVAPDDLERYFVLTLVRNPWDRVVSYYHWLRAQGFEHPAVALAKRHDFTRFLTEPWMQDSLRQASYGSYVTDSRGRERCRLFARIERLAEDLLPFEEHLGFRIGPVPRHNESSRDRDYRIYYTDETRQIVAATAGKDIARFGYNF
ncbi:sulfotransferase domain-containing protein [Frigidibacter sp. ROC022]|uniref:sulfotransferase domain-containing protein n=1 Tax=Frigidibacter sp. ROC022 TaxID=2971796 RepID=UPI00215ACBAB|nr:sulfotransferase domain-containing protein [Frigidibacter sp. ROC022]MCR8723137.1 sulfotransferase domain-containing protein [Frigidibacter sp. ROC022]